MYQAPNHMVLSVEAGPKFLIQRDASSGVTSTTQEGRSELMSHGLDTHGPRGRGFCSQAAVLFLEESTAGSGSGGRSQARPWGCIVGLLALLATLRWKKYLRGNIYFNAHSRHLHFWQLDSSTRGIGSLGHGPDMTPSRNGALIILPPMDLLPAAGTLSGGSAPSLSSACIISGGSDIQGELSSWLPVLSQTQYSVVDARQNRRLGFQTVSPALPLVSSISMGRSLYFLCLTVNQSVKKGLKSINPVFVWL